MLCHAAQAYAQAPPPWIDVPETLGLVPGTATCQTRPTGAPNPPAIIVCDPQRLSSLPVPAQIFLRAHEHGHVVQLVYDTPLFFGPNAEFDADCYAATVLSFTNRPALAATVQWFQTVVGPAGGDITHGNGFQMAQRARECASSVGFVIP
jgi:hypothetical protein